MRLGLGLGLATKGLYDISIAWYGLTWDSNTDTYTRLGTLADYTTDYNNTFMPYSNVPDELLPIQRGIKRCMLKDDGTVNYWLDPNNSTKKADGTDAVLDGTDGQMMSYIPAHWWKYEYSGGKHYWFVSPTSISGWEYFPGGYVGSFEAAMYDSSAGGIVAAADITTSMYASGDKLVSLPNVYPKTNEMRSEYRAAAAERGRGWVQQDNYLYAALARLAIIEYGDLNLQARIGMGRTELSGGAWEADSYISACGLSLSDGNGTNSVSNGGTSYATDYMTYRGVENLWGHIWKFLDGVNIHNSTANGSRLYLCEDPANYADNTDENYTLAGNLAEDDGYGGDFVPTPKGFYPSTVGASSSTKLSDYYYTSFDSTPDDGWRVALAGGYALNGGVAGVFDVYSHYVSASDNAYIGARLCFRNIG